MKHNSLFFILILLLFFVSCSQSNSNSTLDKPDNQLAFYNSSNKQVGTTDNEDFLNIYNNLNPKKDRSLSNFSGEYFEIFSNNTRCRYYPQEKSLYDMIKQEYSILTNEESDLLYGSFIDANNYQKNSDIVFCADINNNTVKALQSKKSKLLLEILNKNSWVTGKTKSAYSYIVITSDSMYYFSTKYSNVINDITNNTFCSINAETKQQINQILE